jgi:hypothetical protein
LDTELLIVWLAEVDIELLIVWLAEVDTELLIVWLGEGEMDGELEEVAEVDTELLIVRLGEGDEEGVPEAVWVGEVDLDGGPRGMHWDKMVHSSSTLHVPHVPLHPLSPHFRLPHSGVQVLKAAPIIWRLTLMRPKFPSFPVAETW